MSYHSSSSSSSSGEYPQQYGPKENSAPMYYQPKNHNPQMYSATGHNHWNTSRPSRHYAESQPQQTYSEMPSTHNYSHVGHSQTIVPAHGATLRTRYPQVPSYSNTYGAHLNIGAYSSYGYAAKPPPIDSYFDGFSPFNTNSGQNSGRSNCHSPTYDLGLTEVLPTRAPGSSVLCLEQRRPSPCRTFICNLKLKHIGCILLALILLTTVTMTLLENQLNFEFEAYQFVKSQSKAKAEPLETAGGENWPNTENFVHSSDEFQADPTHPDITPQIPLPQLHEKMQGEGYSKVVYSFDDVLDDEASIELEDVNV